MRTTHWIDYHNRSRIKSISNWIQNTRLLLKALALQWNYVCIRPTTNLTRNKNVNWVCKFGPECEDTLSVYITVLCFIWIRICRGFKNHQLCHINFLWMARSTVRLKKTFESTFIVVSAAGLFRVTPLHANFFFETKVQDLRKRIQTTNYKIRYEILPDRF